MPLTNTTVDNRPDYVNTQGQTYAAPKSTKRLDAWKQRLKDQGYTFEG